LKNARFPNPKESDSWEAALLNYQQAINSRRTTGEKERCKKKFSPTKKVENRSEDLRATTLVKF